MVALGGQPGAQRHQRQQPRDPEKLVCYRVHAIRRQNLCLCHHFVTQTGVLTWILQMRADGASADAAEHMHKGVSPRPGAQRTVSVISPCMSSYMQLSHTVTARPTARPQAGPPRLSCAAVRTASAPSCLPPSTHVCRTAQFPDSRTSGQLSTSFVEQWSVQKGELGSCLTCMRKNTTDAEPSLTSDSPVLDTKSDKGLHCYYFGEARCHFCLEGKCPLVCGYPISHLNSPSIRVRSRSEAPHCTEWHNEDRCTCEAGRLWCS